MKFYDKRHFRQFRYLPLYYAIAGMHKDGFSYVLYINGGEPPWTLAYPLKFVVFVVCVIWSYVVSGQVVKLNVTLITCN